MGDHDQILAEFQAVTGVESMEQCTAILEQNEWNIEAAVQSAFLDIEDSQLVRSGSGSELERSAATDSSSVEFHATENSTLTSHLGSSAEAISVTMNDRIEAASASSGVAETAPEENGVPGRDSSAAGSSFVHNNLVSAQPNNVGTRHLSFRVLHESRVYYLVVPDSDTVGKLRQLLTNMTGLSIDEQNISGWSVRKAVSINDEDLLVDLQLPTENTLLLTAVAGIVGSLGETNGRGHSEHAEISQVGSSSELNFRPPVAERSSSAANLDNGGFNPLGRVSNSVGATRNYRSWYAWPDPTGIDLTDERPMDTSDEESDVIPSSADVTTDDHSAHPEASLVANRRHEQPLLPDGIESEEECLEHLNAQFTARYGDHHPFFLIGSLEEAVKEALLCSAKDRRLLAVYLHDDRSHIVDDFCSTILCSESVVNHLTENFVTWTWDMTSQENRDRLLMKCQALFGSAASMTLGHFDLGSALPLLLIISRNRGANEVIAVLNGTMNIDEVMTNLLHVVDMLHEQQRIDIVEEEAREKRESVKREQDDAYRASLAVDAAKEEQKRREDEERRLELLKEEQLEEEEIKRRKLEESIQESLRTSLAERLPTEPPEGSEDRVCTIRVRCPDGQVLSRRFYAVDQLQTLVDYVSSKGYSEDLFTLVTNFPRRNLSKESRNETLESLKLYPQETIIVEAK